MDGETSLCAIVSQADRKRRTAIAGYTDHREGGISVNPQILAYPDAVEKSSEVLSGALRFRGTRVPVAALFENLRDGATMAEFLAWFPGVTQAQVEAVLDYSAHSLQDAGVQ